MIFNIFYNYKKKEQTIKYFNLNNFLYEINFSEKYY